MNITSGKIHTAQKVVIYGVEGIGKTTFASRFPDPVFIDTEGGTKFLDVKRFDAPTSWTMLLSQVDYIIQYKPCKTLVLDTIDWAEKLCYDSVCAANNWKSIEAPGYGTGYRYAYEEMGKLMNKLTDVAEAGINVVITAHCTLRKFEQPDEMGAYDRYEMKLQTSQKCSTAGMVKEWADCVLFANYQTYSVKDGDGKNAKSKGQGGTKRVIHTSHHACWDAKNRYGLPPEVPFDYEEIRPYIEGGNRQEILDSSVVAKNATTTTPPKQPEPPKPAPEPEPIPTQQANEKTINIPDGIPKALADLMRENEVDEEEIRLAVSQKGYFPYDTPITNYDPDFIEGCLIAAWEQVFKMIEGNRDLPF
ncbi:MAG: ATP-binding protein [Clostridia bacterium]|nr:ATP-binding protein [Clostridia bacterium]